MNIESTQKDRTIASYNDINYLLLTAKLFLFYAFFSHPLVIKFVPAKIQWDYQAQNIENDKDSQKIPAIHNEINYLLLTAPNCSSFVSSSVAH